MKFLQLIGIATMFMIACSAPMATSVSPSNPLLTEYGTPYDVPPFESIKIDHYLPGIEAGIAEQLAEVDAIIGSSDAPTGAARATAAGVLTFGCENEHVSVRVLVGTLYRVR